MPLNIIRNDITKVKADAVVNTANPHVAVGEGVDTAIYDAAGREKLLQARAKIGEMKPGDAAWTKAFALDADYIIHTVGPVWQDGNHHEAETLASCYDKSLAVAKELGCESVAFPLMAAGSYGFPKDLALQTAINEISGFLFKNEMTVYLVVYNRDAFRISKNVFDDVKSYIEENQVRERDGADQRRRGRSFAPMNGSIESAVEGGKGLIPDLLSRIPGGRKGRTPEEAQEEAPDEDAGALPEEEREGAAAPVWLEEISPEAPETPPEGLEEYLKNRGLTFQQQLFRIIDRKGMKDSKVYNSANISRQHFSKIRGNEEYKPKKTTAVAFAIGLRLNLDETQDLLIRAGYYLSTSNKFDLIIRYCIETGEYNVHEINCILDTFDQPQLGAVEKN